MPDLDPKRARLGSAGQGMVTRPRKASRKPFPGRPRVMDFIVACFDIFIQTDQLICFVFLDITSQAHRCMNTSRGSFQAEKAREGGKRR